MIIDLTERTNMEIKNMTDNEFQNLMDEVLRIVKDSESKDKTVEKLQGLI